MAKVKKQSKSKYLSFIKVLQQHILSHYFLFSGWFVAGFVQAACAVGIPWLLKDIIDTALKDKNIQQINRIGLYILFLLMFYYVAEIVLVRIVTCLLQKGMFDLRKQLYVRVLNQPLSFSKQVKTGEVMFYIQQDTNLLEKNLTFILCWLLTDVFSVVGILTLMMMTEAHLTYVIISFLIISLIITMYIGKPLLPITKLLQKTHAEFTTKLHEVLNGIRTVKTFGRENIEIEKLNASNQEIKKTSIKLHFFTSLVEPASFLIEILGVILIIWYGSILLLDHKLTIGTLLAFLMYLEILSEPIGHVPAYLESMRTCGAIYQRLEEFTRILETVSPVSFTGTARYTKPKTISFQNIKFQYEGSNRVILNNIHFDVSVGKITALVGKNGAGKSTLMDLLMGLHSPQEGQILLNNTPVNHFKEKEWRQKIGVLSQESHLFNDTIANNIAYGKIGASAKEIAAVIKKTGLSSIINRLPNGLQTMVGEKGSHLSGGEMQRIAIARLLLLDPDILIFDEPVSHLDNHATQEFIDILFKLSRDKIVLLIEHRPEIIVQSAYQIVLIDAGKIVAIGTHDTLKNETLYKQLLMQKKS